MRDLRAVCRQGFVVEGLRGFGIERERELVAPPEFEACLAHRIVPDARGRMALCQVGRMRLYLR